MFSMLGDAVLEFLSNSGFAQFFVGDNYKFLIMIAVALFFLYLAIAKKFEPLLLLPISFGMLLANLPNSGLMNEPVKELINVIGVDTASQMPYLAQVPGETVSNGGLLWYIFQGDELGIFPPLIFMGVGALTDFGPLIANPKSLLLGAAAQFGIFAAFLGALALGFTPEEAASIGIIGGADGPTAIFTTTQLAPHLLSRVTVAAYSYMALIPIIQPPIMKALTTKEERAIKMEQLRTVSQKEKILFPIITAMLVILILPDTASLIGMLMLGNLFRESGVTQKLATHASEALMYIISIFIGISVGATTRADQFLQLETIKILLLGLAAFAFSTAAGVVFGKVMCKLTGGKVNPLIGAAGVSAVPMAARVAQKVGQEENPNNYLLMHAMGPNVAGVIGSAIASGIFLSLYR
ncbi:MAG: sodium ion-translocating decarboxylase subunit beta [Clostridia bacterium]|nr:sodium ion-translocating decarboxylase subunit beta [Clostridia bacterium]